MTQNLQAATRPPIMMTETDADKITDLALAARDRAGQVSSLLLEEIDRADIVAPDALPSDVISMSSTVEFVDEGAGVGRKIQLVYPHDADIEQGRISILTPVGAGLIGLREGQSIEWPDRDGHVRALRVVKVLRQ
jgi:regulator of nucleoside diphosphate kinase